jgi:hypothetical protein
MSRSSRPVTSLAVLSLSITKAQVYGGCSLTWSIVMERVTGIEPASRAWEPYNGAVVTALTCGELWSGVTLDDRY